MSNIEAAFEEIKGTPPRLPFRVFFVVAPDGLCYMIGERKK